MQSSQDSMHKISTHFTTENMGNLVYTANCTVEQLEFLVFFITYTVDLGYT